MKALSAGNWTSNHPPPFDHRLTPTIAKGAVLRGVTDAANMSSHVPGGKLTRYVPRRVRSTVKSSPYCGVPLA
jgi:hypothetical protein